VYLLFLATGSLCLLVCNKGDVVLWLNQNSSELFDTFFQSITHLGEGFLFVVPILVALFIRYRLALTGAIAFALTGIFCFLCKHIIFSGMPRPNSFFNNEELVNLIPDFDYHCQNSFPSGHTTTAFAMFFFTALIVNKKWCSVLCIVLAILVALSRVYLLQHFFVDVFVGSLIGVVSVLMACAWINKYASKYPVLEKSVKRRA